MVNPWIWYIINDKMPSIYSGDSKEDIKLIWVFLYWLVVTIIYGGTMLTVCGGGLINLAEDYIVCTVSYLYLLIVGIVRILE